VKPPKVVLSFACTGCARLIRFQEHSGPGPTGAPMQRHHLEKITPGCERRDCPIRWKDVRR
jgi:hypothetical protein